MTNEEIIKELEEMIKDSQWKQDNFQYLANRCGEEYTIGLTEAHSVVEMNLERLVAKIKGENK